MSSPTYYISSDSGSDEPVASTSRNKDVVKVKKKRQALINKLFPSSQIGKNSDDCNKSTSSATTFKPEANISHKITINSVNVVLPVKPYKCQMAVMSKVIAAIKDSKNCLLESPTGTGKTIALLCATLAWQYQEKKRLKKQQEDEVFSRDSVLKNLHDSTAVDITSPQKNSELSEMQFLQPIHGEKSIYDVPIEECINFCYAKKRKELHDVSYESDGLVGITKRVRISEGTSGKVIDLQDAKEQIHNTDKDVTQDGINNEMLLDNLEKQISMMVDCSLPVIYYGARTHKQLEQVVQEFSRTEYAAASPMTILSSRNNTCIQDFDRNRWSSKDDMCKSFIKTTETNSNSESICKYYTNYKSLKHGSLPPAFDLKKLIYEGKRVNACPYYAARRMGSVAQIVFCPYNYLIEPAIRRSMQIDINNNIVIIDEGHNIEDVCREAASFTFKQSEIEHALTELETASSFRFTNQDVSNYIEYLHRALKEWSAWFINQKPLVDKRPVNDGTAELVWDVKEFLMTLDNHNIGQKEYPEFTKNANIFCKKFRENPRMLVGITQATAIVVENLDTVFGYLFHNSGQGIEDYKPVLVRGSQSISHTSKSRFEQSSRGEHLWLSLFCLNPGVVFSSLLAARCVLLASGTLSPMDTLRSELGADFPYIASPGHALDGDRVWVGSAGALQVDGSAVSSPDVQDELGRMLLRVCDVTPHGVLCFVPSYRLMNVLRRRWCESELWEKLNKIKKVFMESRKVEEHEVVMKRYYSCVSNPGGALLIAVYRGKVAEGMDFKDDQARAVVAVGVPYPSQQTSVKEKMNYNDRHSRARNLLSGREWLKVQAYRALNQAAGRAVRHSRDWGAVLLLDSRHRRPELRKLLAPWIRRKLGENHQDDETFSEGENGLKAFMTKMKNEKQ